MPPPGHPLTSWMIAGLPSRVLPEEWMPTAARVTNPSIVMIIGGGNAGLSAAGRLIRRGITDVAVVEPQRVHTYRPLLSYVGGGQAPLRSAERTHRSVTPHRCT
ncbi:FAD-binding protein [Rhodococcus sp. ZPP]|uniref:FAD-binding protein n=1 Tax=Rhodococcus sp. ZPP TaxID=2749906 RepID=UPI001FCC73A7|nr:FAD-binding protein [Rhodococcus sp. ZPP]